jgi:hypothetical protein
VSRFFVTLVAGLCLAAVAGCGNDNLVPVEGKITVDGKPLPTGTMLLAPDTAKGNTSTVEPGGEIKDGQYKVYTTRKPGAPPGHYKVAVVATEPPDEENPSAYRKSLIAARYNVPQTTELSLEVVEKPAPGAYDLNLKK